MPRSLIINTVQGPTSATDNTIVIYDGTTGKLVKDGGVNVNSISTTAKSVMTASDSNNFLAFY